MYHPMLYQLPASNQYITFFLAQNNNYCKKAKLKTSKSKKKSDVDYEYGTK